MRKYFDSDAIAEQLSSHIANSMLFSQNGVRVWLRTYVNNKVVSFVVEVMYEDNKETEFPALSDAMEFADDKQKVR